MAERFLYFAYGSNMLRRRLVSRTPSALVVSTAFVPVHRLTFDKIGSQCGSGKCDLERSPQMGARVYGVLYSIAAAELELLDAAESTGKGYRRESLEVRTPTGGLAAEVYRATHKDSALLPFDWYKELVVAGAVEHALPEAYIDAIRSVQVQADPDADRHRAHREILDAVRLQAAKQMNISKANASGL